MIRHLTKGQLRLRQPFFADKNGKNGIFFVKGLKKQKKTV